KKKSFSNSGNDDYLPYVPAFNPLSTNNIIIHVPVIPITQDINSPEFLIADDHLVHNEPDDSEPAKITVIPLILKTPQSMMNQSMKLNPHQQSFHHQLKSFMILQLIKIGGPKTNISSWSTF
ncbi:hypothetical protein Tco_1413054, partial [Tanacetum coccineum]